MEWLEFPLQLAVAFCLGAALGLERQWRQRMAGFFSQALMGALAVLLANIALRPLVTKINQEPL